MSAKLPLPKQVFGHGFLLNRGEKMSKSTGNVVDPIALADLVGVDALRYFLLRDISFGQDGTFSDEAIATRANADLANSFGNLAQRTLSFIAKNLDGALPEVGRADPADALLLVTVRELLRTVEQRFSDLNLHIAIERWLLAVVECNKFIDEQAPWALRKTDPERMHAVLGTLLRAIRQLAIAILPVVPASANRLLDQLGVEQRDHGALDDDGWYDRLVSQGFRIEPPTPIFPRIVLEPSETAA
jgi:methionyl-tRNA synthetase